MRQDIIDKFNAVNNESVEDYYMARKGGFFWLWFMDRARRKAMDSGFLPQEGYLLQDARYVNSAESVLAGLIAAVHSAESPSSQVVGTMPWEFATLKEWKQSALSFSVMMFDAGIVAALTRGEKGFDPIEKNGPASIFGDVGFIGLRQKSMDFLREVGGEDAVAIAAEVGDCACSHLYADRNIVERAFKEPMNLRQQYFYGVCKAAYVAGSVFALRIVELSQATT